MQTASADDNEALARRRRKTLPTVEFEAPAAAGVAETRRDVKSHESAVASGLGDLPPSGKEPD